MEQETIRAVREAELAAEQIEQEAARQREEILSRAKADAAEAVGQAVARGESRGGRGACRSKATGRSHAERGARIRQEGNRFAARQRGCKGGRGPSPDSLRADLIPLPNFMKKEASVSWRCCRCSASAYAR